MKHFLTLLMPALYATALCADIALADELAVAGLVCITPASGSVNPMSAIIMGLAGGIVCYLGCTSIKNMFGYEDSLDAFGVHGVGGRWVPC